MHRLARYAPDTPAPYTEIRLVRPGTLEEITEARVRGEVCVRGPNVTPGYRNNPDATAAVFLARYKIPTQVLRTDSLPRSPSGKLDKLTIRTWAHDQLRR